MNIKEQIRAEIERRMKIYGNPCGAGSLYDIRKKHALAGLLDFLDSLPEQPVEGLEEEVKRYYADNFDYISSEQPTLSILTNIARHFAEWQKAQDQKTVELAEDHAMLAGMNKMEQQMMENAVEGEVVKDINNKLAVTAKNVNLDKFKFGDKVRVIVIKEDEL